MDVQISGRAKSLYQRDSAGIGCNTIVHEMSDLGATEQTHCMSVVIAVERAMRKTLVPAKVNLASLGNMVAHVHWHVIPRFADDPHFPQPVWGARQREGTAARPGSDTLALAIQSELRGL